MSAVFKRELRTYMNNVYGWLFMAALLMFAGLMVYMDNLRNGYTQFEYALSDSQYALMVLVPVLSMRSMAEDKHNKTDMFYLSLPMKTSSVVLGKYFALLAVLAIPCALLCVYPPLLSLVGEVHMGMAYLSILHFFLLGAALLAVCQFTSSLSDNLVVAAVLGVAVSALLLFVPMLIPMVFPTTPMASFLGLVVLALLLGCVAFLATRNLNVTAITCAVGIVPLSILYVFAKEIFAGLLPNVLSSVSPFIHFVDFCDFGILSIPSLLLFLSYPVLFVFLTAQSADKKRWD